MHGKDPQNLEDDNQFEEVNSSLFIRNQRVIHWPREDMKQLRSVVHCRGYKPYKKPEVSI